VHSEAQLKSNGRNERQWNSYDVALRFFAVILNIKNMFFLWEHVLLFSDAGRRSICSSGEADAGIQDAGHVQTDNGRTGALHVSTGEPSSGTGRPSQPLSLTAAM
jgi:hypothetical protein